MPAENSLGDFQFLAILGHPMALRQHLELDQRNGVAGTEFTKLALKGDPFQILTQVDMPTFDDCLIMYHLQYAAAVDDDPLPLVYHDVTLSTFGYDFKVLNVTPARIQRISSAKGGLYPPSLGWLECVWDLIAVSNE